jgi:hypothetical protein
MSDLLREHRKAFLLALFYSEPGQKLASGNFQKRLNSRLNGRAKAATAARESLAFEPGDVGALLRQLVQGGYVRETGRRNGAPDDYPVKYAAYHLTKTGLQLFYSLDQYPKRDILISVPAPEFNRLLEAYRKAGFLEDTVEKTPEVERAGIVPPATPPTPTALSAGLAAAPAPRAVTVEPSPAALADAIRSRFEELIQGKYAHAGMVPIHELRSWVREKFGPESAGRATFDKLLKQLRQEGALRFAPITDLRDATPEQMDASIPGLLNETYFYLEPAHEQHLPA